MMIVDHKRVAMRATVLHMRVVRGKVGMRMLDLADSAGWPQAHRGNRTDNRDTAVNCGRD